MRLTQVAAECLKFFSNFSLDSKVASCDAEMENFWR